MASMIRLSPYSQPRLSMFIVVTVIRCIVDNDESEVVRTKWTLILYSSSVVVPHRKLSFSYLHWYSPGGLTKPYPHTVWLSQEAFSRPAFFQLVFYNFQFSELGGFHQSILDFACLFPNCQLVGH
ncbi:hypothetical protein TNCV_2954571 [Trichonephila clavipes]|nr:hypothetical protein TNCV_2954571 [Trichonephila clavipes]